MILRISTWAAALLAAANVATTALNGLTESSARR